MGAETKKACASVDVYLRINARLEREWRRGYATLPHAERVKRWGRYKILERLAFEKYCLPYTRRKD